MKNDNIIAVVIVIVLGLVFAHYQFGLFSAHPGQPADVYSDYFFCPINVCAPNNFFYPQCFDLGGNDCFGAASCSIQMSDEGNVFTIGESELNGNTERTLSPFYKFSNHCIKITAPMNLNVVYNGYFTENNNNNLVTVKYSSGWKKTAKFHFLAWITYSDPSTNELKTVSQYWSWDTLMTPSTEYSKGFSIPNGLSAGTYELRIMGAIITSSDNTYPHDGPLADFARGMRPYSNAPNGFGRMTLGQEIGYWERPLIINTMAIYGGECDKAKYTTSGCTSGYTCQETSNLCLRTDILDNKLGCQKIGCPTDGKTYLCGSSGICVETVTQYKDCQEDSDCPSETTCDIESGQCIRTEIYTELIQCAVASDCSVPCSEKSVSCVENRCEYGGNCTEGGFKDCNDLGCSIGTCNAESGVCFTDTQPTNGTPSVNQGTDWQDTTEIADTIKPTVPKATDEGWWKTSYTYILIGLLVLGGIIFYFNKKD